MFEEPTCPAEQDVLPGAAYVVVMLFGIFIEYIILPCFEKKPEPIKKLHDCGYEEIIY